MKNGKVWMVIGASEGLGPAAVRYLLSKHQTIIAVLKDTSVALEMPADNSGILYLVYFTDSGDSSFISIITGIIALHGKIDFLINNLGYRMLDNIKANDPDKAKNIIEAAVLENGSLIRSVLLFFKKEPGSRLINLPPRFCAMEECDAKRKIFVESARDTYMCALKEALSSLEVDTEFTEPGDSFAFL